MNPPPPSSDDPRAGTIDKHGRFGSWRPQRLIGSGGMADVYFATDPSGGRAALKVIRPHGLTPHRRRLFQRECDLLTQLDHPNIVRLLEHGQTADRLWLALQYVAGTSASNLRASRPELLTPPTIATIAVQIASALDYAHSRSVVHRDVKPSNVLVTIAPDGAVARAVLSDFGIAKAVGLGDSTYTDAITGTLGYAAPELLRSLPPVPASDQYSLACTVFTLFTGRAPYVADSIAAQVRAQLVTDPPRASRLADVPRAVDDVLVQAMAKNPADRYPSCGAFAAALADAAGVEHEAAPDVDNRPARDLYDDTIPPDHEHASSANLHRAAIIGGGAAVLAAVAAAVALILWNGATNGTSGGDDDARAVAANQLCQTVWTAAQAATDPPFIGVARVKTEPADNSRVGRGCEFPASVPGVDGMQTLVIGYSAERPNDVSSGPANRRLDIYYSGEGTGSTRTCLVGYRSEVGYLNLLGHDDSEDCVHLTTALARLEELKLTRPAPS